MKRSNKVLLILSVILLSGVFVTDHLLAVNYSKIDLNDPYKNFSDVPVKPFNKIRIAGGNSYVVRVRQGKEFNIKLLNSRASFFKMNQNSDTLNIRFNVSNRSPGQEFNPITGIIITAPSITYFEFAGTNTEIETFKQDTILVKQGDNSITRLKDLQTSFLKLSGEGFGIFDCQEGNNTNRFEVDLGNRTTMSMNGIIFREFTPSLRDSATIVLGTAGLNLLKKGNVFTE